MNAEGRSVISSTVPKNKDIEALVEFGCHHLINNLVVIRQELSVNAKTSG
jgi:hypothetical protein